MREQDRYSSVVRGRIRRRLLVNALVDPEEAAAHLPAGLRPHVVDGGTVVGCCLLELSHVRPSWAPQSSGITIRAAAHRISAEWRHADGDDVDVGMYVPARYTDSALAVLAGGRVFPGVHRRARIDLEDSEAAIQWSVQATGEVALRVVASLADCRSTPERVGRTCLDAAIGVSPGHNTVLEAVEMTPAHQRAQRVAIEHLDSGFVASFASATPAPSYLMTDIDVTWRPSTGAAPTAKAVA